MRGQGYEGDSVMRGEFIGVQAIIRRNYSKVRHYILMVHLSVFLLYLKFEVSSELQQSAAKFHKILS